jgi:hypothetical protein
LITLKRWQEIRRKQCGPKRMTRLWQLGQRAMVGPDVITGIINGREPGKDLQWLLDRYHHSYGKRLKAETVHNIYRNELTYRANEAPVGVSPMTQRNFNALGEAL